MTMSWEAAIYDPHAVSMDPLICRDKGIIIVIIIITRAT